MKKFIILLLITCFAASVEAQNIPAPMSPPQLVNDFAGLFNANQKQQLEDSLVAYDRTTSTQIAVVTVNDLDGYPPMDYALKILRDWGVGRKDKNNGVVVLIKPRNVNGRGEVFIATGYGAEGALPDTRATRIIDNQMIPSLREGDYFTAAERGTAAIRRALSGEYTADQALEERADMITSILGIVIMIIVMIVMIRASKKQGDDDSSSGSGSGGGGIPPIFWGLGGMGSGRSGGGGFGGGSSGGFGGFGGGFGGGGGGGRSF